MPVTSTTTNTVLARKWLAQKLVALSELQLVLRPLCDEVKLDQGMGKTANFAKVARANLPTSPLSEGQDPAESSFPAITNITVTVEQWGAFFTITDVAELTTSHPILNIAIERLADMAARLIDSEIGKVMLAGTNVRFAGGQATRGALSANYMDETELHKLRTTMATAGAPARRGMLYDLVVTPEVCADIMRSQANFGTWAGAAGKGDGEISSALRDATVGQLLGFNVIQSNFLPFADFLGNNTEAVGNIDVAVNDAAGVTGLTLVSAAGGSLTASSTYPWKLTKKDLLRGYEEEITRGHTLAIGAGKTRVTVTVPTAVGFVFNFYFGAAGASSVDTNLFLAQENAASGSTFNVDTVPTTTNPPATPPSGGEKVHIGFVVAKEALNLVVLQNLVATMTPPGESESNPLALRRKVGFKFMLKAGRRDETRLLRWEGLSRY